MKIEVKKNKLYSICSCGMSASLPLCDNAHREYNSDNNTSYKSVKLICDNASCIEVNSSNWQLDQENDA